MPRIKFITSVATPSCAFLKGHVHDATPDMAEAMIRGGNAVAVDAAKPVNDPKPVTPAPKPAAAAAQPVARPVGAKPTLAKHKLIRG